MTAIRKASWEPMGIKPSLDATEEHSEAKREDGGIGIPGAIQCDVLTLCSR